MVKMSRLRKRADFLRLAKGRKQATAGLVLQMAVASDSSHEMRVGFTATRKIGGAVVRNRAKRRLREIARSVLPLYAKPGCDYVLIVRDATSTRPFAKLIEDLKLALRKIHGSPPKKAEEA